MKEIHHDRYQVTYDPATAIIACIGNFRLPDEEFIPILEMLTEAADAKPDTLTLDVRQLRFLNSSGINILARFVIHIRQQKSCQLVIKGDRQYPWQHKSLKNLERLLPGLQLEWE